MKTWIKRTLIGTLGAGLLFGGLWAYAGHRHHHGGWAMTEADEAQLRAKLVDRATRKLDLDAAQQAKLNLLADALQAQRAALRSPGAPAPRAELQAMVAGAQFDRARAQALLDAKTGAVRDKAPAVITAMADFFDSLKPAQQQTLRAMVARGEHQGGPLAGLIGDRPEAGWADARGAAHHPERDGHGEHGERGEHDDDAPRSGGRG